MSHDVPPATVAIVDDDEDLRESLAWLLQSVGLGARGYSSGDDFLASTHSHQVLLLDVRMPGLSGLQVQQRLAQRDQHLPLIMMTGHGDVPMAVAALKAGAFDFIEKPFNPAAADRHDSTGAGSPSLPDEPLVATAGAEASLRHAESQ